MPRRLFAASLALVASLLFVAVGFAPAAGAVQLEGRVTAGGLPVKRSQVELFAAGAGAPSRLGVAATDRRGRFSISYRASQGRAVVYAVATGGATPARGALRLIAVAPPATAPRRLALNELTTVAAAYALARFLRGEWLVGPSPGLPNAAMTVPSLVRPATGTVGAAIANPPNGTATASLATFRTLAAVLGGCTGGTTRSCRALFRAAAPPRGPRPQDTLEAIHAIALNPADDVRRIFALRRSPVYRPQLRRAPSSWVLSLKHTDAPFDGPGRMAFDSRGNIWVTNNWEKIKPTVGGDGVVQFLGAAPPVKTPLIGPPQQP